MENQPLENHLSEFGSRLKHAGVVLLVLSGFGFYFSQDILVWVQGDLGVELNALAAYEVFYTRIMISALFGVCLSLPVLIYQSIKFAEPGLRTEEYRTLRNYLPLSVVLFAGGSVFAYELVVKSALEFFQVSAAGSEVQSLWGLRNTVGFALRLSAFTGVVFQLPIASVVLAGAGILDSETMRDHRNYFLIGLLVLTAVATPPDVVTQILLTLPVAALYELSILLVERQRT